VRLDPVTNRPAGAAARPPYRIVDDLNREWRELVDERGDGLPGWARRHPDLAGCTGLEALVLRASRGEDDVLRALLVEAHGGTQLAARVVLQAMLGRLVRMARRDRRVLVDDYVGAMWCVLARYPLTARPVRIAANLALDTLKTVQRERPPADRARVTLWPTGPDLEPLLELSWSRATLDHGAELRALGATEVIEAGRRLRLIDEGTGHLLRQVYVEGLSGRDAAARGATSPGSLRVRCSRAVRRLAAHAAELVEAA
jgi:DNA-directed RNA polymerase specialized sigma24 family protein